MGGKDARAPVLTIFLRKIRTPPAACRLVAGAPEKFIWCRLLFSTPFVADATFPPWGGKDARAPVLTIFLRKIRTPPAACRLVAGAPEKFIWCRLLFSTPFVADATFPPWGGKDARAPVLTIFLRKIRTPPAACRLVAGAPEKFIWCRLLFSTPFVADATFPPWGGKDARAPVLTIFLRKIRTPPAACRLVAALRKISKGSRLRMRFFPSLFVADATMLHLLSSITFFFNHRLCFPSGVLQQIDDIAILSANGMVSKLTNRAWRVL